MEKVSYLPAINDKPNLIPLERQTRRKIIDNILLTFLLEKLRSDFFLEWKEGDLN
jgi:hypothetical protein